MSGIEVTREKQYLYFTLPDGRSEIRYDLKRLQMQRFKKREWQDCTYAYDYFKDYRINDLHSSEEKFIKMIEDTKNLNRNCKSVSTFVSRMQEALVGEEYIANRIRYQCDSYRNYGWHSYHNNKQIITKPLNFYDKHIIEMFKKCDYYVSVKFETQYVENKVFFDKNLTSIYSMNLDKENLKVVLNLFEKYTDTVLALVRDYRYDIKALINYLFNYLKPFENVSCTESIVLLKDYYKMGNDIGRQLHKFPKYLKSMHDIILANYEAYKKEYNEILFERKIKPELEYKNHKYCMLNPKTSKDVIAEGTNLNHCVSSYVDKIIDGSTYIMFMRIIGDEQSSLVTIEYKDNSIVQAKGSYNRTLIKEEKDFLKEYCNKKQIKLLVECE